MADAKEILFLGLSITSSWGNGHATNYRGLLGALRARGHRVRFLERDVPWYAAHRDMPSPQFAETSLYGSLDELRERHGEALRAADAVVVGSYVPDGRDVAEWALRGARGPVLFYDIDTPVTIEALERGGCSYLSPELVPRFGAYLSFTGGPVLRQLEERFGARRAVGFYCLVDASMYRPDPDAEVADDLGYLGTYSEDRQEALDRMLIEPALRRPDRRFVVAGPQYPPSIAWPANVRRLEHVPPGEHREFYCSQRFTLNVTRREMIRLGYSPSVRLFEAAACGTAIISDRWPGIEEFFVPDEEILLADSADDVLRTVESVSDDARRRIGLAARRRVLGEHTAEHRAAQLEEIIAAVAGSGRPALTEATP